MGGVTFAFLGVYVFAIAAVSAGGLPAGPTGVSTSGTSAVPADIVTGTSWEGGTKSPLGESSAVRDNAATASGVIAKQQQQPPSCTFFLVRRESSREKGSTMILISYNRQTAVQSTAVQQ